MALLLLVPPLAAQAQSGDRDPRGHSLLESEGQFGVRTRAERRWLWETDSARRGSISEAELIHRLTSKPGKRRMGGRGLGQRVYIWLKRTSRYIEQGDYGAAYRSLGHVPRLARTYQRQTRHIHALMSDLAARYVIAGDLDRAVRIYEEMLLLGRYLPPRFTGASLNNLVATHFDLGDYETALMYVRVGIAVLDDVGIGPYRAMDRIIREMADPETAVDALEEDFETALARLESAVASAEAQGLIVDDQWWAPVYRARHDREEAIRILRTMLAPLRDDPGDILRETSEHGESAP
ncbi:MAG: hypothetical protein OXH15_09455 [Gammaproteobacteria bacterium]|nr:hypothetical protein [Gammaproteobacteria bacterium]